MISVKTKLHKIASMLVKVNFILFEGSFLVN